MRNLPPSWRFTTLDALVDANGGFISDGDWIESKDQDPRGAVRLIQLADIGDGAFLNKSSRFLTVEKADELGCSFLQRGDILVARMPDPIGRACVFPGDAKRAVTAVDVCIIRPPNGVESRWLVATINSPWFRRQVEQQTSGTTRQRIARSSLCEIEFLLAPFSEQKAIANVLEGWDKGIGAVNALLDAKKAQKAGLIQQLLTGKTRFKEFDGLQWRALALGDILTFEPRVVTKPKEAFLAAGVRSHGKGVFLKPDFEAEDIALDELFQLRTDDLVVNITFAWEGAIAIVPPEADGALVSHRFPTFTFKRGGSFLGYFRHVIRQKRFVHELGLVSPGGAGRNRVLSKTDFLRIRVELPSVEEQQRIAGVLNACDREIELLQKQLDALKEQKRGLMQKLLTGEIRVKG